jgi:hypothetical protein
LALARYQATLLDPAEVEVRLRAAGALIATTRIDGHAAWVLDQSLWPVHPRAAPAIDGA